MRHANPCLGRFLAQAWQAPRGSSHCDLDDEKDDGDDDDGDDDHGDNDGGDGLPGTRIASNPIEARATVIRMMMLIYIMPMRGFGTKIPQFCQKMIPSIELPNLQLPVFLFVWDVAADHALGPSCFNTLK